MDWFAYYELAQKWANNEGEAHKRSAVSRAYYAMFHTARYKLKKSVTKYNPPDCGSEHTYMWELYKENPYYRQIGVLGTRLRKARNKADYDDFIDNFPEIVETAMLDAEKLNDALEDLRV